MPTENLTEIDSGNLIKFENMTLYHTLAGRLTILYV